jgi:hypothetical protein
MSNVNTSTMQYDKARGVLTASLGEVSLPSFPQSVKVTSAHTGRVVEYAFDTAKAEANEFWDGEEAHYYSLDANVSAKRLILYVGNM